MLKRFQNGLKDYDVGNWNWSDGEDPEAFVSALTRFDNISMIKDEAVSRLVASLIVEKLKGTLGGWWMRKKAGEKARILEDGWLSLRRAITKHICNNQWLGKVRALIGVMVWRGGGHREETPIMFLDRKLRLITYVYSDESPQLQLQQLLLGLERWITALRITNAEIFEMTPNSFIKRIMQEGSRAADAITAEARLLPKASPSTSQSEKTSYGTTGKSGIASIAYRQPEKYLSRLART